MKIKKNLKIRKIAGENVLIIQGHVGADMTKVISFNATAEWLWNNLSDKDFTIEDIVKLLTNHFNIDNSTAHSDALEWMKQLQNCNALES